MKDRSKDSKVSREPRPASAPVRDRAAATAASLHRLSWRAALRGLTSPAFRLHHFRDVRTRMFYDALSEIDDCKRSKRNGG